MLSSAGVGVESRSVGSPAAEDRAAVQLDLSPAEAKQLRALGGSAWLSAQLAANGSATGQAGAGLASDYLAGLAQALFPLPVSGPAVRLVDELRRQRMVEAAVTFDDTPGGDGDRAIVRDITSLGRTEIERLARQR